MLCSPRCVSPRALPTLVQTPGAAPGGDMYIAVPSFFITARCWPNEPSGARKAVTGDGFSSSESDIATARATHRRAATQSCHAACRIWQAPWQLVNVRFYPLPTWGRCSPTWGHGRPACNPTPGSRRARATPTSPHPPPCAGSLNQIPRHARLSYSVVVHPRWYVDPLVASKQASIVCLLALFGGVLPVPWTLDIRLY